MTGVVFRFLRKGVAQAKDFLPNWDLYPQHREAWTAEGRCCEARGLSVYRSAADALAKRAALPTLKKMQLGAGSLEPEAGVIAHTARDADPGHHTWWSGQTPDELCGLFALVRDGADVP